MKKILVILFLLFLNSFVFADDFSSEQQLRKKIAQMLIVGFNGTKLTKENPIYDDILNERISGVIIFAYDMSKTKEINGEKTVLKNVSSPKQLKTLISDMQKLSKTKLFISIDEEGGMISRLPCSLGFKLKTLSHKELGEINNEKRTYKEAKKIAKTLKNLGININFAPCVDLGLNPQSKVIYQKNRAFGVNPEIVSKHARQYILAHKKYGIITTLKHFPGHGSVSADTHKGFADSTDVWSEIELYPYENLISQNLAQGVMVSHIFNKNLDENYPASLSKNIVDGMLKKQLNFKGLIITDDIQMGAIKDNFSLDKSIISAINAGADLIILGNNLNYDKNIAKKFNDIVFNAVKNNEISIDRINESYEKINFFKEAKLH